MIPTPLVRGLSLGAFTGLSSLGLAFSSQQTKPVILAQEREDQRKMLAQVVPAERSEVPIDRNVKTVTVKGRPVDYYMAERDGKVSALAFQTEAVGYSGVISMLVGIEPDGTILGVRVTSHTETPGLGDRIEAEKGDWILGFAGKSLDNPQRSGWAVTKDGGEFDALSGATITPRAVVRGVFEGLERFELARSKLLSTSATKEELPEESALAGSAAPVQQGD